MRKKERPPYLPIYCLECGQKMDGNIICPHCKAKQILPKYHMEINKKKSHKKLLYLLFGFLSFTALSSIMINFLLFRKIKEPTAEPIIIQTIEPTATPTLKPITSPIITPTAEPSVTPTVKPTKKVIIKSLTLNCEQVQLNSGESFNIKNFITILPEDATEEIKVTSSNDSIVKVSGAMLSMKNSGSSVITLETHKIKKSFIIVVK